MNRKPIAAALAALILAAGSAGAAYAQGHGGGGHGGGGGGHGGGGGGGFHGGGGGHGGFHGGHGGGHGGYGYGIGGGLALGAILGYYAGHPYYCHHHRHWRWSNYYGRYVYYNGGGYC